MRRLLAMLALLLALVGAALPAAHAAVDGPADANHCREIYVHFRPAICTENRNGVQYVWVCPDGWWNYCVQVLPLVSGD